MDRFRLRHHFLPYKVITITSGTTALGLGPFILASVVARALLTTLFFILLIGGFVIVHYLA